MPNDLWTETGTILSLVTGDSGSISTSSLNSTYPGLASFVPTLYRKNGQLVPNNLTAYSLDMAKGLLVLATNWKAVLGAVDLYLQGGLQSGKIGKITPANYDQTGKALKSVDQ